MLLRSVILLFFALYADGLPVKGPSNKRVLLISFDGFRYDLLNSTMAPAITKWAEGGTWFVNGVSSQYISYTAPNHMSIVTGLREESHGIVSNFFYDPESKTHYDIFNMTTKKGAHVGSLDQRWYFGEPIWLTNQKAGGRSALFYWPMSDAHFPMTPHVADWQKPWRDYGNLDSWEKDADEILQTLSDPTNTFISWYVAEPDHTLHTFGFYFEDHLKKKVAELDRLFGYLILGLERKGLSDKVDIILTADHGHAEVRGAKNVMCIPDYIKGVANQDYAIGDHMIYPANDEEAKTMYDTLQKAIKEHGHGVRVFYRKDLPSRYYYSKTNRVGTIVLEPLIGSSLSFFCTKKSQEEKFAAEKFHSSTHGMDPQDPEMRAFLVMRGPSFYTNKKVEKVPENIDLYGVMAHLLNATPAPNNGTMEIVREALRNDDEGATFPTMRTVPEDSLGFAVFVVPSVIAVTLFIAYAWRRTVVIQDPTFGMSNENRYAVLTDNDDNMPVRPKETNGQHGLLSLSDSDDDDL